MMETTSSSGLERKPPVACNHGRQFGYDSWYTFHCQKCMGVLYNRPDMCGCGQPIEWENDQ